MKEKKSFSLTVKTCVVLIGLFLLVGLTAKWLFEVPFYKGLLIALAFLLPVIICSSKIKLLELQLSVLGSKDLMEEILKIEKAKNPPRKSASRPSNNKKSRIIRPLFHQD
jgi:hypothetical protein